MATDNRHNVAMCVTNKYYVKCWALPVAKKQRHRCCVILSMWCVGEIIKWNHLPSLESPHSHITLEKSSMKTSPIAIYFVIDRQQKVPHRMCWYVLRLRRKYFHILLERLYRRGEMPRFGQIFGLISFQPRHTIGRRQYMILYYRQWNIQRRLGGMQTTRRPQETFTRSNSIHKIIVRITALSTLTPG